MITKRAAAIARGVVVQAASRVLGLPLSVITLGIATRYLGEHDYGVLTTAVVFVGLFDMFTELGMGTAIVRRVTGREKAPLSRLIGLNLTLSTGYALPLAAVAVITGIVVYHGRHDVELAIIVMAAGLVFDTVSSCFDPVFDVFVRYGAVGLAEFSSRVLTLVASLVVVYTDAGLLVMCAVQVLPQLIRMVVTGIAAARLVRLRLVRSTPEIGRLLRESLPFTLILLIAVVYWRADGVLLSLLSSNEQVAAYGVALQLAFTLSMLPQMFSRSAMSTINEGYAHDPALYTASVDRGYRFLLLFSAPVAVLGIPLSGRIVTIVGSAEFAPAATPVLAMFFVACSLTFLTSIASDALIAAHEQAFLTKLSAANLVANIALNAALIPVFGATGTGIALVVTELSGVVFTQPRLRRVGAPELPMRYLARLLPGLALALVLLWLTWQLPLVIPVATAGVGYLVGAWACGALPPPMRAALLGALRPGSARRATANTPASTSS